ncbi:LCP family protein required for cell wall assembly [Kribbella aluminosa]|uniref:LCP family protein required for cell wall assembly n=1 Tax=Kribbella aluminosa TaxID=416017 RepID=A0ABS4UMZ2_9ACTN|nr:LCP family protein [Kribbella aluminosa]MBP2352946.1 LCP family protein required for cell wall assembly [Kribbella aluminosa]
MPRRGKVLVASLVSLLLISSCGAGLYFKLDSNLASNPLDILGQRPDQPAADAKGQRPLNVLVLGSQTRNGQQGSAFGNASKLGTDISDTAMLVHLSADRQHAIITSIPRDLVVARPACVSRTDPHATVAGSNAAMFDLAMSLGGPSCAVATVEHMANLRVDHFIRLDFNGFRKMVDAVGGVEVCVPYPGIHDWRSKLDIPPGKHLVTDQEALAFVRDRHGIGDGGDLGRIKMQQMFVSSLAQKLESAGTLANPVTLYKLADAATSSLTVDPGLGSIDKLVGLAEQLRSLKTNSMTFITAPNTADSTDPNRVVPAEPQFNEVFQLLRSDQRWTGTLSTAAGHPGSSRTKPGQVAVRVLNATGVTGKAATVRTELTSLGFHVSGIGTTTRSSTTTVSSGPGAELLRSYVAGSPATAPAGGSSTITLTIGSDFAGIHHAATAPKAAAPGPRPPVSGVQSRGADANICSGLPTPRADAGKPTNAATAR